MSDVNFWKDKYKDLWAKANHREKTICAKILEETTRITLPVGLGAGTDSYLPGTAASQGYGKGDADLQVVGTSIYLEVTGPQSLRVPESSPLWIRPDKVSSAQAHHPEHDTWVVHWLEANGLLRVIHLDSGFFERYHSRQFGLVTPTIRGVKETYVEIRANDRCVQPWPSLIEYIRNTL